MGGTEASGGCDDPGPIFPTDIELVETVGTDGVVVLY